MIKHLGGEWLANTHKREIFYCLGKGYTAEYTMKRPVRLQVQLAGIKV